MHDAIRLLVFDLSAHLHLPAYLRLLIESWNARAPAGELTLVVHPTFAGNHADVVELAERAPRGNVRILTPTEEEHRRRRQPPRATPASAGLTDARTFAGAMRGDVGATTLPYEWQLLRWYAGKIGATRALIVHVDAYLLLLAAGVEPPCPLSGIFFAPMFHYGGLGCRPSSEQEQALALRQKFLLARVLRQERIHRLFMLDPFAVEGTLGFPNREKVVYLPDPVPRNRATAAQVAALRAKLGVDPGRSVLLMFGHLTPRKGCSQLLDALTRLPEDTCRSISVVFAGVVRPDYRPELERRTVALCAERPVEVIRRFGFVAHEDVAAYFRMADVVLTPYPRHPGMSGVVLLAAAAGVPVLGASYGLMGEYVRRYRLGVTVDATDPEDIAAGLSRLLAGATAGLVDQARMRRVAKQHEASRFGATLLDSLLAEG